MQTPEISSNSFSDSNDLLFCVHQYYKMNRIQVPEGYKAQWLFDHELSFAYLLADHKSRGTLNKASIVKTILPDICKRLNEDFGLSLTVGQLTTKYYSLKHLARLYNNLVRNEAGMGWDPVLECPTADDERWEKLIQTDKNYSKFKNQCCTQYKVLNEVFEDTVATGRYGQSFGNPFTQPNCDTEELNNFSFSQFGRVVGEAGKNRAVDDDVQILEKGKGKKRDYDSSGKQSCKEGSRGRKESKSSETSAYDRAMNAFTSMCESWDKEKDSGVEEYTFVQKGNPAWSVDKCMKALDELGQLPSVCVARAMDRFNKESVREIFMCGSKGQRTAWVMNLGGKNRAGDDDNSNFRHHIVYPTVVSPRVLLLLEILGFF